MATINVRGWNSYSSGLDVREMIEAWGDPEVLVLTETKRASKKHWPPATQQAINRLREQARRGCSRRGGAGQAQLVCH
jgi:hypothetical protein